MTRFFTASTLAMTIYNLLAVTGPMTQGELYDVLPRVGYPAAPDTIAVLAARLARMGYVERLANGTLNVKDEKRRRVRSRNRDGDGWDGWMVEDPRGLQPIEAAAGGQV